MNKILWVNLPFIEKPKQFINIELNESIGEPALVLFIIANKIDSVFLNATQQNYISYLKKQNEYFPIYCFVDDEQEFPKDINPFHCFTKQELNKQTFNLMMNVIEKYNKEYKEIENHVMQSAKTLADYNKLISLDDKFHKMNWGYNNKIERTNIVAESLDNMDSIINKINNELSKNKKK